MKRLDTVLAWMLWALAVPAVLTLLFTMLLAIQYSGFVTVTMFALCVCALSSTVAVIMIITHVQKHTYGAFIELLCMSVGTCVWSVWSLFTLTSPTEILAYATVFVLVLKALLRFTERVELRSSRA